MMNSTEPATQRIALEEALRYKEHSPDVDEIAIEANLEMANTYQALMAAFSRCLAPIGIETRTTRGRSKVLRLLYQEEQLPQHEISKKIGVTPANVTHMIDGLEREGLALRIGNPDDRRVTFIQLTEKGNELASRVVPAVADFMATTCRDFSDSEKRVFADLLVRMRLRCENSYVD